MSQKTQPKKPLTEGLRKGNVKPQANNPKGPPPPAPKPKKSK